MRRRSLSALLAPLFVLFAGLPAKAYLPPHDEHAYVAAVVACMQQHLSEPLQCLEVVLSPCEGYPWKWDDPCQLRLAKYWRERKDAAEAAITFLAPYAAKDEGELPLTIWYTQLIQSRIDARKLACIGRTEQITPNPEAAEKDWLGACIVLDFAEWWFLVEHRSNEIAGLRDAHLAEVESLEACILESGAAGQAEQCIGLFGDLTCEGLSPTCGTSEFFVFVEILHSSIGADAAQAVLSDVGDAVAAGEHTDCSDFNECIKKHFARRAIDAFLEREALD